MFIVDERPEGSLIQRFWLSTNPDPSFRIHPLCMPTFFPDAEVWLPHCPSIGLDDVAFWVAESVVAKSEIHVEGNEKKTILKLQLNLNF